jgi:hypothetical protein
VEQVSRPREWRDAALRVHVNYLRNLLQVLARGQYDDCDPELLDELERYADDLRTTVDVARKSFQV